jgi:hypothetical protein
MVLLAVAESNFPVQITENFLFENLRTFVFHIRISHFAILHFAQFQGFTTLSDYHLFQQTTLSEICNPFVEPFLYI